VGVSVAGRGSDTVIAILDQAGQPAGEAWTPHVCMYRCRQPDAGVVSLGLRDVVTDVVVHRLSGIVCGGTPR